MLSRDGVATRCEVREGDFFADVPGGADLYLLSWVLHDWPDPHAVQILANCRRAMSTTARLPALSEVDDRTFVVFMQQTITTMTNGPIFLGTLMGGFVFTGVAAILQYRRGARSAAGWTLAALALYVAAMAITAVVHFPLNDTLVQAGDPDTIADLASLRADTEGIWVTGHVLRTVASMVALMPVPSVVAAAQQTSGQTGERMTVQRARSGPWRATIAGLAVGAAGISILWATVGCACHPGQLPEVHCPPGVLESNTCSSTTNCLW